jgi:hypothetical protein
MPIDLSGLYIVAAPSTPAAAVDEVIETAKTTKVTKKAVKSIVAKHKTTVPVPKAKSAVKSPRKEPSAGLPLTPISMSKFREQFGPVLKRLDAIANEGRGEGFDRVRTCVAEIKVLFDRWKVEATTI